MDRRSGAPPPHGKTRLPRAGRSDRTPPGLPARQTAVHILQDVLGLRYTLDEALARAFLKEPAAGLAVRDRAFVRLLTATVLRRLGEIEAILSKHLTKPLPTRREPLHAILAAGAAQMLFLDTPPYAAIGLAVETCRRSHAARRFTGLVNAVLRRVAEQGKAELVHLDPVRLNVPPWLLSRWEKAYGAAQAREIALASLASAALDLTVKADAQAWAEKLGATLLPTGSLRLSAEGRIEDLPGFQEGTFWVQDAAAALPARLLEPLAGMAAADLCAAPGGKTAQLAAAGARVTAVDISRERLERVRENLARLHLPATLILADAATWQPRHTFERVLLDAPCTATGTLRRHPDILHLKQEADVVACAGIQERLLENAARLVAPGGLLVYCVCSLEKEEGPQVIARFLSRHSNFQRLPIRPGEAGICAQWITPAGDLATFPCSAFEPSLEAGKISGLDGFYAARLGRSS